MADQKLQGKRVAIIAADMVERVELIEPRKALEQAGATTDLISLKPGMIKTFNHFDPAESEKVDKAVEEVDASDYDALMIPGGVGNPDQLRGDENMVTFVRDFFEQGKPFSPRLGVWSAPTQCRRNLGRQGDRRRRRARDEPQAG